MCLSLYIDSATCVCMYPFKYRFVCVSVFHSLSMCTSLSFWTAFQMFCFACLHTRTSTTSPKHAQKMIDDDCPLVVHVSLPTHVNHHSVVLSGLALSSCMSPLTMVWVSRSLLPTSLFEHLSMGEARNPPTQWTTSSAWSVLPWPWWPCRYRTCVIAERLSCRHRLALAARYEHSTSDSTTKRTVQNKLDFNIGDHRPVETVVLGEC